MRTAIVRIPASTKNLPARHFKVMLSEMVDAAHAVRDARLDGDRRAIHRAEVFASQMTYAVRCLLKAYGARVGSYPRGPWRWFGRAE